MARTPIEDRIYLKNGMWRVHGSVNGKAWNASTGCREAERDQAVARAAELERERLVAGNDPKASEKRALFQARQRLTLSEAVRQLYHYDTRQNAKPKTREYHEERCVSLMRDPPLGLGADSRLVDIIDRPKLLTYFTHRLEGATLKQRHTIQKDYKVLRLLLRINKEMGFWEGDLSEYVFDFFQKSSKFYAPGETWLDEIEYIDAFVEEVSSGRSLVKRTKRNGKGREWVQRACVRVDRKLHVIAYLNLGLRDAELDTIYEHHVSLKHKTVAVNFPKDAVPNDADLRRGKTIEAKRVLGLNPVMVEAFKRKLKDCDPSKPVFEPWPSARRDIQAAWRRARKILIQRRVEAGDLRGAQRLEMTLPQSLSLNDLRRTFCSQMAKAGVPLQTCADLLGHSDDTMVKLVYRRCAPAQLQAAMEMMPTMALPVLQLKAPNTQPVIPSVAPAKAKLVKASGRKS